jgi:cobalt/nickel transport system ATP-binding protein
VESTTIGTFAYVQSLCPEPGNRSDSEREAAFRLNGVTHKYNGEHAALNNVTFEIAKGEKVAILGANGSGKSTLLKVLNGLEFPDSGSLQVFGEELNEDGLASENFSNRFRRRVAFVFQNPDAQLFSSTVHEEIAFGPLQLELPGSEIEGRMADISAMLEIGHLLGRPPFQLSGGEKKKVALASVLVINPDVILFDEPTNGLDPRSQRWLIDVLVKLNAAGKTIVSATHDLDAAREISDRVIVMNEDHGITAIGPTNDILCDLELLTSVNLIHEHMHWHGDLRHSHPHHHDPEHDHHHHHHDHAL